MMLAQILGEAHQSLSDTGFVLGLLSPPPFAHYVLLTGYSSLLTILLLRRRLFLVLFLLLFWKSHHVGICVVVHQTGIAPPGNHSLEDLLRVFVRKRGSDIMGHRFRRDLLLSFEVRKNDMEQT